MYLFPKLIEAAKNNMLKLKYPIDFKYGTHVVFAFSMGAISSIYQQNVRFLKIDFFDKL